MLLYIVSGHFPHRTFVVRIQVHETIARIRAQLLHILYELGKDSLQFRLRYKSQYLRDAYTVEDYQIVENAIVKMVPLAKRPESVSDLSSMDSSMEGSKAGARPIIEGQSLDVKEALQKEVKTFNLRERLTYDFKTLLYLHALAIFLGLMTTYWYSAFWTAVVVLIGILFCPTFTRLGGYIGKQSIYKTEFCVIYGLASLTNAAVAIYLATVEWQRIVAHGCKDFEFVDDCSHRVVYSGVYFSVQALVLLISSTLAWLLLWNIQVEYGDYVEKHLVQSRDIEEVMKMARNGRPKEKRVAAFEMATMAATGDDNKFRIVAEGGLQVLMGMALSPDEATQEQSVEAIAEMLTVPAIQDAFVEAGGVRTLTALLHSRNPKILHEATTAISYIVSDSEENKHTVVDAHGLEDLCHAAYIASVPCQRIIAGILLDLAFNPEVRTHMAAMNTPAQALMHLIKSSDEDTQRFALQTLELLAIENPDMVCAQDSLLGQLVSLPMRTMDDKILVLAGKILLYYAENRQTCEALLAESSLKDSLRLYAKSRDPILQKVVVKLIFCMLEEDQLKIKAKNLGLGGVLKYVQEHALDREAWDMADQALQLMNYEEDLTSLPAMSTVEKLSKMGSQGLLKKKFGSHASIGSQHSSASSGKAASSLSGSASDLKKGTT